MNSKNRTSGGHLNLNCLLLLFFVCGLIGNLQASSWPYQDETSEQRDARMAWWRQARFGMFIHWGVYAVPAGTYNDKQIRGIGEWIMNRGKIPVAEYKEYAKQFSLKSIILEPVK